ncbi:MAG: hypothetical protein JO211_04015 [Acidobacteriaceae bacterium]|nr:hypothetical protein [Acidobacteriaceae bacterium]
MGDEDYVLTLSAKPEDQKVAHPLKGKHFVTKYPNFVLCGAQAIYYPTKALRNQAADYLTRYLTRGCGDDLIGRFARSYAALYATTQPLVSHIGAISCFEAEGLAR